MAAVAGVAVLQVGGLIICDTFRNEHTKTTYMGGGVKRISVYKKTDSAARIVAGIMTVGITEISIDHDKFDRCYYVYENINLGQTRSSAARYAGEKAKEFYRSGNFQKAVEWYDAASSVSDNDVQTNEFFRCSQNVKAEIKNSERHQNYAARDFQKAIDEFNSGHYSNAYNWFLHLYYSSDFAPAEVEKWMNNAKGEIYFQRGMSEMKFGQYKKAVDLFEDASNYCSKNYSNYSKFIKWKNNARAEQYYKAALEYYENKRFQRAFDLLQSANNICSADYTDKVKFITLMNKALEKVENGEELKARDRERAMKEFVDNQIKRAHKHFEYCNFLRENEYNRHMTNDRLAENDYNDAMKKFNAKQYEDSLVLFKHAYNRCSDNYKNKSNLLKWMNNAYAEIYYKNAMNKFNARQYEGAISLFEKAIDKCSVDYKCKFNCKKWMSNAKSEMDYKNGVSKFYSGDFHSALDYLKKAYNNCAPDYKNKSHFLLWMNKSSLEAKLQTAVASFNVGGYEEAFKLFRKAYNECDADADKVRFKNWMDKTYTEIKLSEANLKLTSGDFEASIALCEEAIKTCAEYKKLQLLECLNDSRAEQFYKKALVKNHSGNYKEANTLFRMAKKCNPSNKRKFQKCIQNTEAELLFERGLAEISLSKYEAARKLFESAMNTCEHDYENLKKFEINFRSAQLHLKATKFMEHNNFEAAFGCIQRAIELASEDNSKCLENYASSKSFFNKWRNNAKAEDYYKNAVNKFNARHYEDAMSLFKDAYNKCSEDYANKSNFKKWMNNTNAEVHYKNAMNKFNAKHYEDAMSLFKDAYNKCSENYTRKSNFKKWMNNANAEIDYKNAVNKFNCRQYEDAFILFKEAYNKYSEDYTRKSNLKKWMNNADAEVDYKNAMNKFNAGQYEDAFVFFKDAYNKFSEDYANKSNCKIYMENSKAEVDYKNGVSKFNSGHFQDALVLLKNSSNNCSPDYQNKSNFLLWMNKSLWEVKFETAIASFNIGGYEKAFHLFEEAYNECASDYDGKVRFKKWMDRTLMEIKFNQANLKFTCGEFEACIALCEEAIKTCTDDEKLQLVKKCLNESRAEYYYRQALDKYHAGNYKDANMLFRNAEKCNPSDKRKFKESIQNTDAELFFERGLAAISLFNYKAAKELFTSAMNTCVCDYKNFQKFEQHERDSRAALLHLEARKFMEQSNFEAAFGCIQCAIELASEDYSKKEDLEACFKKIKIEQDVILTANKLTADGLVLFENGKLKEWEENIEVALRYYNLAKEKYDLACEIRALDTIFDSYLQLILAFVRTEAFDEAELSITKCEMHFPSKLEILRNIKLKIAESPDSIYVYMEEIQKSILGRDLLNIQDV